MKRSTDITQILALSLFMIVLAFFIVLNTISDFKEEKIIPVLASLEAAFASKIIGAEDAPALREDKTTVDLFSGGLINDLELAFKNNFDVLSTRLDTTGTILQIQLNRQNFLSVMRGANTLGYQEFRQKLLLFMNNSTQAYRVNIIFNEKDPLDSFYTDQKVMPDILMNMGVPYGQFKIITRKGDDSILTLVFMPQSRALMLRGEVN